MVAFMLAHAATDGFSALFPPLLPLIREHFNLSYVKLGGVLTSYTFFGSLLQIPMGYLSYIIPSSTLMVTGLFWVSSGLLLATFSKNYWGLITSFSFAGMGTSTYHPLSFSFLSKFYGKETLGRVIGLHMGASSAAHLVTPLLVILLANRYGWSSPIRVWCFYGMLSAAVLWIVLRKRAVEETQKTGKIFRLPFMSRSLVFFILFRFAWAFSWRGMSVFIPIFLVETAHFSIKFATLYFMAMYLIELFARPMVGVYSDKIGKRKIIIIAELILCALFFLALTIFKAKLIVLFIIMGLGFVGGSLPVVAQTYVMEMIPDEQKERTLGYFFTIHTIAATFAPLFVGVIADYFGLMYSFLVMTASIGVGLIFLIFSKEG